MLGVGSLQRRGPADGRLSPGELGWWGWVRPVPLFQYSAVDGATQSEIEDVDSSLEISNELNGDIGE